MSWGIWKGIYKAINRHRQREHTKGKSYLSNFISFSDKVTCLVDEGKAADVTVLDFGKAFDTVLYGTLLDGLSYCETNEFILCWVMNWLDGSAQGVDGLHLAMNSYQWCSLGLSSRASPVQHFCQLTGYRHASSARLTMALI